MTEDSNILSIREGNTHTDRKIDDLSEKVGTANYRDINTAIQGFAGLNTVILQQIGDLRNDLTRQHFDIVTATHGEAEKTRDLISQNAMQSLRDRAEAAERKNDMAAMAECILGKLGTYWPKPPYIPA